MTSIRTSKIHRTIYLKTNSTANSAARYFSCLTRERSVQVSPYQTAGPVQPRFHGGERDTQPLRDFVATQLLDVAQLVNRTIQRGQRLHGFFQQLLHL